VVSVHPHYVVMLGCVLVLYMIILSHLFVGFVLSSGILLYSMFLLVYVFHLSLRLLYPVKSRRLDQSEHNGKIHIVEISCVFIVGTVPYLALAAASKFKIAMFPPLRCVVTEAYTFYGSIVPTIVLACVSMILMLLVLYKIHIVSYY